MARKERTGRWFIIVGVICIVVALYGLYGTYKEYKDAKDIYDKVENEFVHQIEPEDEKIPVTTETESESIESESSESESTQEETPKKAWYESVWVDLEGLQSKYSEVVGWIYFENEAISYPLMQSTDNNKYVSRAYDGSYSTAGSIFVEATHKGDFSGIHTIVYGHNKRAAHMFGRLKNYRNNKGYYQDHQYFQIFSGDKIYRYQIFAYQVVGLNAFIFQETYSSADVLAQSLLENSMIKPGIEVSENDKIVSLCTCTETTKNRFIVSAVLVETYDRTDKILIENESKENGNEKGR